AGYDAEGCRAARRVGPRHRLLNEEWRGCAAKSANQVKVVHLASRQRLVEDRDFVEVAQEPIAGDIKDASAANVESEVVRQRSGARGARCRWLTVDIKGPICSIASNGDHSPNPIR